MSEYDGIWGVDLGTMKAGRALLHVKNNTVASSLHKNNSRVREERISVLTEELFSDILLRQARKLSDIVFIEEPVVKAQFYKSSMAIIEMLGVLKGKLWRHGIPFQVIGNNDVKKRIVGKGNSTKEEVRAALKEMYKNISDETDLNETDAIAIALAGKEVICEKAVRQTSNRRPATKKNSRKASIFIRNKT